jgi:signal transduction histidine kinase
MFTGYSARQGLRSENNGPVYVDSEDRTWFAPPSGGLYWLKDRQIGHVTVAGLDQDVVYSITGGGGEIWVGRQHGGLTVLKKNGDSFAAHTYTESDGLAQNSVSSVHRSRDGTVWAGTVSAGISKLSSKSSNAAFTNYSVADGLASSAVFSIVEGDNGTMWFATPSGLSSFDGGKWKNYAAADGLPSSNIRSIFEDSKHVLWIATAEGLAFLASGRVNVPAYLTDSLREEILGITEDKLGSLWIVTSDHVLQVSRDRLLEGLLTDSDVLSYGTGNGLPGSGGVRRDRSVVADAHGRIWISLTGGLATADPAATARRAIPVSVRIESISAGGRPVPGDPSTPLKLASGTRSITVNYASSNLSIPQRIRFRYRLDKSDQGWSDDVALRQVVYTNLGPGSYQIRIVASNGMGLWNGPETVIQFSIAPAFWQTWWFRLLSVLALGLAGLGLYRLRFYQLSQEMNLRFQERLAERSRIAQELHDTLLQGVLSASLQLDVVEDQTPEDSPTKPLLKRILQLMGQVIDEGRIALRGLRAPDGNALDIETAFSRVRQEFATNEKATYRVLALGASRPLRPMIRDEVYRIGHEAVVNSFRHSRAANIEVEVEYADTHLRVLVRDDGIGIDPRILKDGREGHWGLTGMRERSERIGANLRLRSRIGAGTEVELTVSRAVAFGSETTGPVARWLPWFSLSWLHLPSPSRKKFNRTENGPGNENRPDQSKRD